MNEIERWYDEEYDEWTRLDRHKIEFEITKRYLDETIQGENLEIFDIGGGPGRYSIYLAEKGHKVSLLDLSKRNIEKAKIKAAENGVALKDYIHGNALELAPFQQKFDVILLMGPLYHLVKREERAAAVEGALRLLKRGGLLVASFISSYAPIQDSLKHLDPIEETENILSYLEDGLNQGELGFTTAYFINPLEAKRFMNSFELEEIIFAGIENVLGSRETAINQLDEGQYKKWLDICYRLSRDQNLIGTSEHLLYIGRKNDRRQID
ncbi:class I SAM-dependent methyltransferase [Neobacillus notoginsengisoli]|uniref:Class I SAM-dependent methyltransferase n=1 Tax=Neobacillus notoginsengisoli TaxID=1578198 RepID=A0A417YS35_9BACI|nr:class I SAM-dependent methyltransferase [Neobacillus notoginsengisoli]RHW38114.1 class I SAM-dependent methyltransferase [Neobacillus notoginsengisoli]